MKKTLLSIITLGCTMLASAANAPTMLWNKLVDGPQGAGDNMYKIAVATDGNIITIGNFGSRTTDDKMTFDGQVIATGAYTNSSSDNQNLLVTKHNASDGSLIWALSTKNGDVASNGTNSIAATSDGGAVLLVNMRSSSLAEYVSPVIVDASGAEIDFPDWNTSCWMKNQVVIRVNKDGYVQWVKRIVADQLPVPNASSGNSTLNTTEAAFPNAIAVDKDNNIYVAGNHRASLIFTGDKNSTYVLQPRNVETYSGDVQSNAGGLYLVKLDPEGNYLTHLQGSAANGMTADYINSMVIEGDMIYFAGYLQGKAEATLTLGKGSNEKSVTKLNANNAVLAGAVQITESNGRHQFVPRFLTCINEANRAGSTSHRIQFLNLNKIDSSIYLMGTFQGAISTNESETPLISSQSTMLEGFIARLNANDGSFEKAMANGLSIGGYRNVFSHNGRLFAQGYRMNAQTGTFIDELDPESLSVIATTTVAKAGGAPSLQACAYDPATTAIYTGSRGSAAFTLTDNTTTDKPASWCILLSAHAIDTSLAAAESIKQDNSTLTVKGLEGAIEVIASDRTDIRVVDTKGITVTTQSVETGTTTIALPEGIYIVNNLKVAVR